VPRHEFSTASTSLHLDVVAHRRQPPPPPHLSTTTTPHVDHDHDNHDNHTTRQRKRGNNNNNNTSTAMTPGDEGGVWAVVPSPSQRYVYFHCLICLSHHFNTVNMTRRKFSSSPFCTCRGRNHTLIGVISYSACFYALPHTPRTEPHQRGCDSVFGVSSTPYHTRRGRNHTLVGVIPYSACFLRLLTHAEHETTPLLVSFRGWHVSYALFMPSTKPHQLGVVSCSASFHRPPTYAEHEMTP
jgi:hypothetical protein